MYAVILAGGGGTRLWPLSRRDKPKPFLPLLGDESLFQQTLRRLPPEVDVYVIAEEAHMPLVREQAPHLPADRLIGEPVGRNTCAAVALAALKIDRPMDDVMAVLPADHRVKDETAFRAALAKAGDTASADRKALVTLGITPTGPATGYGYIVAADDNTTADVRAVDRFVEKPTREKAEELLRDPRGTWWNAGIFLWRRDRILHVLEHHAEDVFRPLRQATDADLTEVYSTLPSISIDYAVMEPVAAEGKVKVVPMSAGWSDVGDWRALREELAKGGKSVVSVGRSEDLGSEDVLVHSSGGRLVVTVGLRDMIVVDTPDVVLVCDAERAQEVRTIVERLAEAKETDYL